MRVLEFSLDPDGKSSHSPHNQDKNCVCYIATHDNIPVMGWLKEAKAKDLALAKRYFGLNEEEGYNFGFIRGGMSSPAYLFVCQMQDYLGLGKEATINAPGTLNNWKWRLGKDDIDAKLAKKIALYTRTFGRSRIEKSAKTKEK